MPLESSHISLTFLDSGQGVLQKVREHLNTADLLAANREFFDRNLQEFSKCRYWLSDFTEVITSTLETTDLQKLSHVSLDASRHNPDLVVAICTSGDLIFGLWEAFPDTTGWTIRVFRSLPEGQAWIREMVDDSLTFR